VAEENGNLNCESILVQSKFPETLTHKSRSYEQISSLAYSVVKSHFRFHFLVWKRTNVMRLLPWSVLNLKGTLLLLLFPRSRE